MSLFSKHQVVHHYKRSAGVQLGFVLKALWAVDLIDDFIRQIKSVGLKDHVSALLEATQPMRVRGKVGTGERFCQAALARLGFHDRLRTPQQSVAIGQVNGFAWAQFITITSGGTHIQT